MSADFLIEDEGDGWWHCPSPLECFILDGPTEIAEAGGQFWLVRTRPAIVRHSEPALVERWGEDHPINQPFRSTDLALVMAVSNYGTDCRRGGWAIPAYPVVGNATSVVEAASLRREGAKVHVVFPAPEG